VFNFLVDLLDAAQSKIEAVPCARVSGKQLSNPFLGYDCILRKHVFAAPKVGNFDGFLDG